MAAVYLDSCIVIYLVEEESTCHEAVRGALCPAAAPSPDIRVSDLTRLECRVWPLQSRDQALLSQYDAFFGLGRVVVVPLTSETFDLATELRAEHGIRTVDALHLAAAITGGSDEFWTNDRRLARAAEGRIRIHSPCG